MKKWNSPAVEEVEVMLTEYAPAGGNKADGEYHSLDGEFLDYSYGPSSGSYGTPSVHVE